MAATGLILTACAPANDAVNVSALAAGDTPKVQVQQTALTESLAPAQGFERFNAGGMESEPAPDANADRPFQSSLQFFETALSYGPADPRYLFLMVNAYNATSQQAHGIAYLERLLKRYGTQMDDEARATHLAAYAILRATYADEVPLTARIGWVLDTFDLLDDAKALTGGGTPLVRWAAGLIYAQVPFFFGKHDDALAELTWLAEHPETEPIVGFYREVYHHLAKLHADDGNKDLAARYLKQSGYDNYEPSTLFMGWLTTTRDKGLTFAATPWMEDVVPGRVFAVRGFGFSDMHFVVTADGKQLVSIDAGTQPYSMEAAYTFLKQQRPNLPPLTTALITHAHWDHVGGYTYLKKLNPGLRIYGRENYQGTLSRVQREHSYVQFRGSGFDDAWVSGYRPDVAISQTTRIEIGGTEFELVPARGGETEDAMLIFMPAEGVAFVGDTMMPFYGEPWVEEGFIDGALVTMGEIVRRKPKHVLHGHYGLTFMYGPDEIAAFREAYRWLVEATRSHLNKGYSAKQIVRLNLIPPALVKTPNAYLGYIAPRDHIITRTADHFTGIWQEDASGQEPAGLDVITAVEYGRMLETYLGLSADEVEDMLERMIAAGDNELALAMAVAAEQRYGPEPRLMKQKRRAADRLRSLNQFFDPFKFVVYTEIIGQEHKAMSHRPLPTGSSTGTTDN